MARGFVVGVAAAAIVVVGLSGCSSKEKSVSGGATVATGSASSASAGIQSATISIDGQPKTINGQVVCATVGGNFRIAIGEQATGVAVMMAPDASRVTSVGLGNVNGVVLGYQEGAPGGSATATKDGKNYTITGTATGIDMANPMQPMTKPFEIKVSCP